MVMVQQNAQFIKNLERFRLITFDVTETLLRFKRPVSLQYKLTASEMGINIDEVQLQHCFRRQFKSMTKLHPNFGSESDMPWQRWWTQLAEGVFASVAPDVPAVRRTMLVQELLCFYRTQACWTTIEGANELLEQIGPLGKCVGVISNFDASLEQVLGEMQLRDRFDFILTSYAARAQKPSRRIFDIALECGGLAAGDEALHIGNDYELDYMGARNAGWSSLLVAANTPKVVPPSQVYDSLGELLQALRTQRIQWN